MEGLSEIARVIILSPFFHTYWQTAGYCVDFLLESYERMAGIMRRGKGKVMVNINDYPDVRGGGAFTSRRWISPTATPISGRGRPRSVAN
jgi:hypothetical protein